MKARSTSQRIFAIINFGPVMVDNTTVVDWKTPNIKVLDHAKVVDDSVLRLEAATAPWPAVCLMPKHRIIMPTIGGRDGRGSITSNNSDLLPLFGAKSGLMGLIRAGCPIRVRGGTGSRVLPTTEAGYADTVSRPNAMIIVISITMPVLLAAVIISHADRRSCQNASIVIGLYADPQTPQKKGRASKKMVKVIGWLFHDFRWIPTLTPKQNPVWSSSTVSQLTAGIPTQTMGFRELGKLMSQHDDYDCSQLSEM